MDAASLAVAMDIYSSWAHSSAPDKKKMTISLSAPSCKPMDGLTHDESIVATEIETTPTPSVSTDLELELGTEEIETANVDEGHVEPSNNQGHMHTSDRPPGDDLVSLLCCLLCCLFLFIPGVVVASLGLEQHFELAKLDPTSDFALVEPYCTVHGIVHEEITQHRCRAGNMRYFYNCGCSDTYSYFLSFDATLNGAQSRYKDGDVYSSESALRKRHGYVTCGGPPASPQFEVGDKVKCWRPTSPPDQKVNDLYNCGDDFCIKTFSPGSDWDDKELRIKRFLISGFTLLGAWLFFSCPVLCGMIAGQQHDGAE